MNITHQLQGPLTSLIFSLSAIKGRLKSEWFQKEINFIKDLADDAIALSYGTFTSFAAEVGDASGFVPEDVDVVHEVRELAERLQRTTGRLDLEFEYKNSFEFETISIDHNLLTSVLYSLIHNAMKYADESTKVVLECGIERRTNVPGLKVKSVGAPIQPHESEKIFQKFGRGHLVKKTGRYHRGVGLGLWVARTLMQEVGGDLTVELSPLHPKLSVFVIHFPQAN